MSFQFVWNPMKPNQMSIIQVDENGDPILDEVTWEYMMMNLLMIIIMMMMIIMMKMMIVRNNFLPRFVSLSNLVSSCIN